MERDSIILIGDAHTVNAFRICGIESFVADAESAGPLLGELIERDDVAVIAVTTECGEQAGELINSVNLNRPYPVIVEIPGVDSPGSFEKSLIYYITEALGVAI